MHAVLHGDMKQQAIQREYDIHITIVLGKRPAQHEQQTLNYVPWPTTRDRSSERQLYDVLRESVEDSRVLRAGPRRDTDNGPEEEWRLSEYLVGRSCLVEDRKEVGILSVVTKSNQRRSEVG
jgi:hypothetical protein